jgi:copper resistance protein B
MKIQIMLLLSLLAIHRYAQAADEHAGHTVVQEGSSDASQTVGNEAANPEHDHDAETTQPAHVHDAATDVAPAAPPAHVHEAPPAMQTSVLSRDESAAMQEARHMNMMMHGETLNTYLIAERFEQNWDGDDDSLQWEMQGWVGRDLNKFWFKTEGAYDMDDKRSEETEVQALFSRAIAPYWDLQAGVRQDNGFGPSRSYAVIGLQGLAPYWFEVDAAAFISERGDVSSRVEAEYELRFTQRTLLQSRVELDYAFADDVAIGAGKGLRDASFGLRLRHEVRREFAPYIGVEWHKAYGDTATYLDQRGIEPDSVNLVAGIRVWY